MSDNFLSKLKEQQCRVYNHSEKIIQGFCFNTACKESRATCFDCASEFHSTHGDNIIQVDDLIQFIKDNVDVDQNDKENQQVGQEQIISSLQKLNKLIVSLQELVLKEIQKLQNQNMKSILQEHGQPGYKNYNIYIEKLLKYFEVKEKRLQQRNNWQLAETEQQLTQIIDKSSNELNQIIGYFEGIRNPRERHLKFYTEPIIQQHDQMIKVIALSQDYSRIATGSADGSIIYYDPRNISQKKRIKSKELVQSIAISPNKKYLALGSQKSVQLYDMINDQFQEILQENQYAVNDIVFSSDSEKLITGGVQQNLIIWDVITRNRITSYQIESDVSQIVISEDNKLISCICLDGEIYVWNCSADYKSKISAHDLGYGLCSSKDMQILVSCGTEQIEGRSEGVIKIWKFNKNKLELAGLIKSNDAMEWDINRVILTSDEKYIISTCTVQGKIRIHQRESKQLNQELFLDRVRQQEELYSGQIQISKNMNMLVSCSGLDGCLYIWQKEQ